MMKHNIKCESARATSKCVCRCGGALHGIQNKDSDDAFIDERSINENMGGEIGEIIKALKGKTFLCSCKNKIIVDNWLGYQHPGGLSNKDGLTWWIYVRCPNCEYDWSWNKVKVECERPR